NFRIDPQALSDEALADLAASRPDRMPAPVVGLPSGPEPPVAGKGEPGKAFTYFMNVGGEQFRDKTGRIWSKGQVFRDGGHGWQGGRAIKVNNPNQVIGSCVVDLQAVRLTVPDGNYRLTLVFCDQWANRVGERRFDLSIEGKAVHRGFDPLRVAGGKGRIFVKRLPRIAVRDGRLDIEFSGKGRMISGVGVEQILPAKSQGLSGSAELAGAVSQRREAAGAKALEAAKALLKTNETDGFDALRNLALRHRGTGAAAEATETMDAIKQDTGRYTRIRKALEERDARKQLAICKQYIVINKPEVASRELRKLIKDYGQTSVADEARLLLHGLEQQRQR
ncbi:MAG: malectin, partial [Phycisphaerae bacterium]|nr:malectin [Phycisphaerae bacterium]